MSMLDSEGRHAPSIATSRPMAWVVASAAAGSAVFCLSLSALWRPLPGLPEPAASLGAHAAYGIKSAAHALAPRAFAAESAAHAAHWKGLAESGELFPIAWRACLSALLALLPGAALAKGMLARRDGLLHLRGPRRHEGRAARALLRRRLAKRCARRPGRRQLS